jgi:hypothetical protein
MLPLERHLQQSLSQWTVGIAHKLRDLLGPVGTFLGNTVWRRYVTIHVKDAWTSECT